VRAGRRSRSSRRTRPGRPSINIESLSDVVQRNPNDATAFNTRGAAFARSGRYSDAIADFNKALQIDPNNAPAYTNRGLAHRQTNRADAAYADFTKAIQADANYGPAYIGRANLERTRGNFDALSGPDTGDPPHAGIGGGPARARARLSEDGAAPRSHHRLRRRNRPQRLCGGPYEARGQSLIATRQYDKAAEDFNAALNVNNKNADAWAWRGVALDRAGKKQEAAESFARATAIDPNNSVAKQGLGRGQGGVASLNPFR
jgi:tetratricopeptide (TPR) repeat protein